MESPATASPAAGPLVRLEGVYLGYGPVRVLRDISLTILRSETHALVGEHAAGKSSLCHLLAGLVRPTSGRIWVDGQPYAFLTPRKARGLGVGMVHQHNPLFDNLTVADNLFVAGDSRPSSPLFDRRRHAERARRFLREHGFGFDPETPLRELAPADRILIDILKRLHGRPKLVILDEALDKLKSENLYRILGLLNRLKAEGTSVLFVTHRIDDIYQIADRVTIIRGGEIYLTDSVKNIDKINLIRMAYTQISAPQAAGVSRKEFYQLLRYNEAILQNLPVNLIVVDTENRVKMVNEQARRYFALEPADSRNVSLERLFLPANPQGYALLLPALGRTEGAVFYDVPLEIGEARRRNDVTLRPIFDGSFRIGSMIIIEDITEREGLREQMGLSEKLASLGLLAAGVAHEINSPLETIRNFTEYLKHGARDPEAGEVLDGIDEEVSAISRIVGDLISFSETERPEEAEFDLNELIGHVVGLVRFGAGSRRIDVRFDRGAGPIPLKAARGEIRQVVLNLLKNSFDALPEGGEVRISSRLLEVEQGRAGPFAEVAVQDNGTGIQRKNVNDVFLPFFTTKSPRRHMGLGLSISYGIVKKHGGEVSVVNLREGGCRFRILLPCGAPVFLDKSGSAS